MCIRDSFRIYPDRKQQGTFGYVSRTAIDKILNGEDVDLSDAVFVYELEPGEGAENGIAAVSYTHLFRGLVTLSVQKFAKSVEKKLKLAALRQ